MKDQLPFVVVSMMLIPLTIWLLVKGLRDPNRKRGFSWTGTALALLSFVQPEIAFSLNGFDDSWAMKPLGIVRMLIGAAIIACICLSLRSRGEVPSSRGWNIVRHMASTLAAFYFLMVGYGELMLITIDKREAAGSTFTVNDGANGFRAYGTDYELQRNDHGETVLYRPIPLLIELNSVAFDLVKWDKFKDNYLQSYANRSDIINFRIRDNSSSSISSEFQSLRKDGMVVIFDKIIADNKNDRLIQTTITTANRSYSIMVRKTIDRFNAASVALIEATVH